MHISAYVLHYYQQFWCTHICEHTSFNCRITVPENIWSTTAGSAPSSGKHSRSSICQDCMSIAAMPPPFWSKSVARSQVWQLLTSSVYVVLQHDCLPALLHNRRTCNSKLMPVILGKAWAHWQGVLVCCLCWLQDDGSSGHLLVLLWFSDLVIGDHLDLRLRVWLIHQAIHDNHACLPSTMWLMFSDEATAGQTYKTDTLTLRWIDSQWLLHFTPASNTSMCPSIISIVPVDISKQIANFQVARQKPQCCPVTT